MFIFQRFESCFLEVVCGGSERSRYWCCSEDADLEMDIGVARILSAGVHFFTTQQKLLKIDSCSGWGVHLVSCGGALTHFSCKLGLKKIFHRPGGCRCTHCTPPGYAYGDGHSY